MLFCSGKIDENTSWNYKPLMPTFRYTCVVSYENDYWVIGCNESGSRVYHYKYNQQNHIWSYKYLPYPNISNIFFINEQKGWAFGENKLLFSSNGGTNWSVQKAKDGVLFTSIDFVSINEGWLSQYNGKLFHTLNSGNTWEEIYSNPDYLINSIDFIDENTGWAVGRKKGVDYTDFNGFIISTLDGGKTWNESPFSVTALYKVKFINKETGYAMGDKYIIATNTGGQ